MPSDYNKLTKPDLEAQLKERGLSHTGKKADLVARLQEDDAKKQDAPADSAAAKEDEIDWDDDVPKDAAPAVDTKTEKAPAEAHAVETTAAAQVEATTAVDGNEAAADATTSEAQPQKDYSLGLAQVTVADELEKLKARAKKFNLTEDQAAQENIAKLERAQKFGGADDLNGLNGALPERQRKRRGGHVDDGRVGKPRGRGGRSHGSGRREGPRNADFRQNGSGGPGWMSQRDREAAEARKKRFAT